MKHFFCRNRQGYADGMSAPQHQGNGGLFHAGDQLGDGQAGLYVAPRRVQKDQQTVDVGALLNGGQQGQNVLVFGGL